MSQQYGKHLSFPFRIGDDGRTQQVAAFEQHVKEELIQLLLTNPGERLFVPELGGGVRRLVFEGAGDVTAGILKATLTRNINRWLGHRITLQDLRVTIENESIEVEIRYRPAGTGDTRVLLLQRKGG